MASDQHFFCVKETHTRDGMSKKTVILLVDKLQALQVSNLQWQPSTVGLQIAYTMVTPEYE